LIRRALDLLLIDHASQTAGSLRLLGFRRFKHAAVAFVLLLGAVALKFGYNAYVRIS
jgi:hypothetical protein